MAAPGAPSPDPDADDLERVEDDIRAAERERREHEGDDEQKFVDTGSKSHGEDDQTIAPG